MLEVELIAIENENVAVVSVDGVIERHDIQIGTEDYIEIKDRNGELIKYYIYELKEKW